LLKAKSHQKIEEKGNYYTKGKVLSSV